MKCGLGDPPAPSQRAGVRKGRGPGFLAWLSFAALVLIWNVTGGTAGMLDHHTAGDEEDRHPHPTSQLELELETRVEGHALGLGAIGAIVADHEGRIFVADVHDLGQEIVVLNAAGSRVDAFGGRGQGPAEFTSLQPTLARLGDTLVALDARQQRVTLFDPVGQVVATRRWPIEVGMAFPARQLFEGGDDAYLLEIGRSPMRRLSVDRPPEPPEPPAFPPRYLRLSADGRTSHLPELRDSLADIGHGESNVVTCMTPGGGMVHFLLPPFSDRGPLRAFTPAGELVKAHRDAFRIDIIDGASGDLRRSIRRTVPPLPLRDEDWEALPEIQLLRRYEREAGGSLEALGDPGTPCPLDGMRPETLPVLRTVVSDEVGRIWLEVTTREGFALALLDRDGAFLGQTRMPDRDSGVAPYARGDRLYLVTVDDLGLQGIEVYRARFGG